MWRGPRQAVFYSRMGGHETHANRVDSVCSWRPGFCWVQLGFETNRRRWQQHRRDRRLGHRYGYRHGHRHGRYRHRQHRHQQQLPGRGAHPGPWGDERSDGLRSSTPQVTPTTSRSRPRRPTGSPCPPPIRTTTRRDRHGRHSTTGRNVQIAGLTLTRASAPTAVLLPRRDRRHLLPARVGVQPVVRREPRRHDPRGGPGYNSDRRRDDPLRRQLPAYNLDTEPNDTIAEAQSLTTSPSHPGGSEMNYTNLAGLLDPGTDVIYLRRRWARCRCRSTSPGGRGRAARPRVGQRHPVRFGCGTTIMPASTTRRRARLSSVPIADGLPISFRWSAPTPTSAPTTSTSSDQQLGCAQPPGGGPNDADATATEPSRGQRHRDQPLPRQHHCRAAWTGGPSPSPMATTCRHLRRRALAQRPRRGVHHSDPNDAEGRGRDPQRRRVLGRSGRRCQPARLPGRPAACSASASPAAPGRHHLEPLPVRHPPSRSVSAEGSEGGSAAP